MKIYTAVVERCTQTGLYVGFVPGFAGAHTQAESLDELNQNLKEVIEMLLEDGITPEPSENFMNIETLKKRLDKNRPMTEITLSMPVDVVEDLKRVAIKLGFSDYLPLIRAYIGQSLRRDLELLEEDNLIAFIASLERHGVNNDTIKEALSEIVHH